MPHAQRSTWNFASPFCDPLCESGWLFSDLPQFAKPQFQRLPGLESQSYNLNSCGPVAQLGERKHGMFQVAGSIPVRSTKLSNYPKQLRIVV